jgi:deoxyadenosine/deoxycytidine kinase
MSANRYIVIEGVIGAGKTSLTRLLAERLQGRLLLEEVEENPFLKDFYVDRARYAFQTQMHFLFSRYQQQRELRQQDLFRERTVADYLFQKDRIFANLNLSDKELALYEKVAGWLELEVTRPDVVVYLQADTATLLERVAKRGRPFERDMDRDYMQALNEAYNYFFFHYTEAPLLVVNTNGIDFVRHREDLEDLEARILAHHEGTVYYTPMPSKDRRRIARRKGDEPGAAVEEGSEGEGAAAPGAPLQAAAAPQAEPHTAHGPLFDAAPEAPEPDAPAAPAAPAAPGTPPIAPPTARGPRARRTRSRTPNPAPEAP